MSAPIEDTSPETWQDLEWRVARILRECGYEVATQRPVKLAGRGDVNIDVWADDHSSPPNVLAVECKHWTKPVPKSVVHAFRTVVGDSGANTGLLVSSTGFQTGAIEAASYSNVRLVNWVEFQALFAARWYRNFMAPEMRQTIDPLIEYTEPINIRIARKAERLPPERRAEIKELRQRHLFLGLGLVPILWGSLDDHNSDPPDVPLRASVQPDLGSVLPDDVLDATALRSLMRALDAAFRSAIREFDQAFGGRA